MKCTLYAADVTGVASNCLYLHRHEIDTPEKLAEVVAYDTVCGHFRNDYRNGDNFLGCDCVMLDCDNDHSDAPEEWIAQESIDEVLRDVSYAITHMFPKGNKTAIQMFHITFRLLPALTRLPIKQPNSVFIRNFRSLIKTLLMLRDLCSVRRVKWCGMKAV